MQQQSTRRERAERIRQRAAVHDQRRAVLHCLLDESLALSPEYGPQLSSHLPMALEALHALGATAERMREFSARYSASLEPCPPGANAKAALGVFGDYAAWRREFGNRLAEQGMDAALRDALAVLMPGVGSAAFHGLIRVGHAVRAEHKGELAAALAYWACRFQPIHAEPGLPMPLDSWLDALAAMYKGTPRSRLPAQGLISERMAAWAGRSEVQAVAARLSVQEFPALALAAARLYAVTRNFAVLHVVTSSAAMLRLRPWLDDRAMEHFIAAAGVGLLASGAFGTEGGDLPAPLSWDALAGAAIGQDDDHVIKLVLACRELDERWPDALWRCAATRAIRMP